MARSLFVCAWLAAIMLLGGAITGCDSSGSAVQPPAGHGAERTLSGADASRGGTPGLCPGVVSDSRWMEWCGTFSPDGTEYYFYRYFGDSPSQMFVTTLADGVWTSPEPCAFTGEYSASEPHLTFDDQSLYFDWQRKASGPAATPEYYFVRRTADGWSEPEYAGQGMFMSSTRAGDIYVTDMSDHGFRKTYLARVDTDAGAFKGYERLDIQPYYGVQAHPGVAPDGSYMLFDVDGGSHLFVSFRQADGTWGEGIDLTKHGFDPLAGGGYVSPDGEYVFFALKDDIWWVDAEVIENLPWPESPAPSPGPSHQCSSLMPGLWNPGGLANSAWENCG